MIVAHNPPAVWRPGEAFRSIYSHAVEVPAGLRRLHIAGQIGLSPDGRVEPGFGPQLAAAMDNVEALLAAAQMRVTDLVRLTIYLVRAADLADLVAARQRRWASERPPAVTVVVVAALARPELLIEIEGSAEAA